MGRMLTVLWVAVALVCGGCSKHSYTPSYKGATRVTLDEIRFDDGDTFFLNDTPVRVLAVDTPEIAHPAIGFLEDQPYGVVAAESTRVWITRADLVEVLPAGKDRYGRTLAHVFVDGQLLSVRLIENRLGYETVTHFGDNGFPDLAQRVLDASEAFRRPPFEEPYQWRKKHRKKTGS